MKRFIFKFEKLLIIKEQKEEEAKLRYSKVLKEKLDLEQNNISMNNMISNIIQTTVIDENNKINVNSMHFLEEHIDSLKMKIHFNNKKKELLMEKLEKLRQEYIEATKEKKIIEKIKENDYTNYKIDYKKEEIKKIDEIAGQRNFKNYDY